ncbi:surfactant-associated protein 3 isoform X2 [Piliocolobus tephrosceles]|uniref:surfactant-associated protein 3 isoform X2 n=1 Tax=Colobus angolensis palliatus TaxID=336983 RepID=UPI0005F500B1|nr:PREDICTED: surfactant-associated protein 3 isoform X2 [Colobus angolensis palliatus]XP_011854575.1 PREDICTED: surfactant-associated protein 3 isoform X3 [Mandrillus leucophaeus]XP_017714395.1 PREDICTED: surfactant-associated protein 3 isoform X3 [Rhinopithecus bieti]XP_023045429.1 surfactant-associated protein 3 isoform X2 [Piliocolobus tephrosceles]XP_025247645.1 surfactant-associated protein 3 isoform X3 [Theropithecus gelada]
MRAGFSDFQLIRDQVLFIQDQAQRLTEWLQLSGFENPVSESTTLYVNYSYCMTEDFGGRERFICNIWNTSGGLHQHRIYTAAGASQS